MTAAGGRTTFKSRYDLDSPADKRTVAVVITTFNHARFLAEAIESVLAQTRRADEIIVVDDGSTDDPATIVARFPMVRLIRQDNRGPSAARNAGLRNCSTSHVVFLAADDRLLPSALEAGLACIATNPECAFVYGGHRLIAEDGCSLSCDIVRPFDGNGHLAFLRQNLAGSPVALLFRRDCLVAVNGFDEALRGCEDYDLYLRLAGRYPIASHPTIIAEYRKHSQAISNDYVRMIREALLVLDLDEARITSEAHREARRDGRAFYRSHYASRMLRQASARWQAHQDIAILASDLIQAARWAPGPTLRTLLASARRRARKALGREG